MIAFVRAVRRRADSEAGFTMVELLMAISLLATAIVTLISTFDTSRTLVTTSERVQAATHAGERQMERIHSLLNPMSTGGDPATLSLYDQVELKAAPPAPPASDATADAFVCRGTSTTYRWDQTACGAGDPLVIAPAGDAARVAKALDAVQPWTDARGNKGLVHTYITWVDADCPNTYQSAGCDAQDYKRITVAVTTTRKPPGRPVVLSSYAYDPDRIWVNGQEAGTNPCRQVNGVC